MKEAGMDGRQERWQKWYLMVRRHRRAAGHVNVTVHYRYSSIII